MTARALKAGTEVEAFESRSLVAKSGFIHQSRAGSSIRRHCDLGSRQGAKRLMTARALKAGTEVEAYESRSLMAKSGFIHQSRAGSSIRGDSDFNKPMREGRTASTRFCRPSLPLLPWSGGRIEFLFYPLDAFVPGAPSPALSPIRAAPLLKARGLSFSEPPECSGATDAPMKSGHLDEILSSRLDRS